MIRITYTHVFKNDLRQLLDNEPELKATIDKTVERFAKNPNDTRLELHALRKRLKGKHAISVTGDIRIVFQWLGKTTARFLAIGPHTKVYSSHKN